MIQISTWIISWYMMSQLCSQKHTIISATGNLVKQLFRKSLNKSQIPVRVDYDSYICWGILKNYTFTVSTLKYARLKVFCSCNQVRLVLEPEIKHQLNTEVINGWSCLCDVTLVLSPTGQPLLLCSQSLFLQTLWRSSNITKTRKTWTPNLKLRCSSYLWWEETCRTSSISLSLSHHPESGPWMCFLLFSTRLKAMTSSHCVRVCVCVGGGASFFTPLTNDLNPLLPPPIPTLPHTPPPKLQTCEENGGMAGEEQITNL